MRRHGLPLLLATALSAAACGSGGGFTTTTTGPAPTSVSALTTSPVVTTTTALTTTSTTTTTIPPTTTSLPPAIPVAGWEGDGLREVSVVVEFDYPGWIPALRTPVEQALRDVGVTPSKEAEAVLRLQMTGSPEAASYTEVGTCYSGARLTGTAGLSAPGRQELVVGIEGGVPPPEVIYADECAGSPEDAPFDDAFAVPLVEVISTLFGPASVPYLTAVVDIGFPEGWWDRWYGRLWAAIDAFRDLEGPEIPDEAVYGFLQACLASIWWLSPDFSASPEFSLDDDMRHHIDRVRQVLLGYSDTDYGFEDPADIDEWRAWLDDWLAAPVG